MSSVARSDVENSLVEINEEQVRGHLDEVVRQTVEETLNTMLDAEAISSIRRLKLAQARHRRKQVNLGIRQRTLPLELTPNAN